MPTSHHLVCSLLVLAACSSVPEPTPEAMPVDQFAPAPIGEFAMPSAVEETAGAFTYVRSDAFEIRWRDVQARNLDVAFELSCRVAQGREDDCAVMLQENRDEAREAARDLCAGYDLTTEQGQRACEDALRAELDETLFGTSDGRSAAKVERIVWKRVIWN